MRSIAGQCALPTENADRACPSRNRRPPPAADPSQRAASTRRKWPWATHRVSPSSCAGPLDDPVGPPTDVGRPLALGHAVVPQGPSGRLPDLGCGHALVGAVVPLHQVGVGLAVEAGQLAGLRGPIRGLVSTWANVGESARATAPGGLGLLAALVEQGNVGASRVLASDGPLGRTVPEQHHPGGHGP